MSKNKTIEELDLDNDADFDEFCRRYFKSNHKLSDEELNKIEEAVFKDLNKIEDKK